ncbi:MAG: glycosyltransferase family 1 protein [Candidatus Moraniibacteriota bacterium]|nr:MAG: glycosyltransferase family 1 protein [Candidatus Moranbacteria bacterium]
MLIGIDASRAFGTQRTGTENYSYEVITRMLRVISAKKHTFVLFIRPNAVLPPELGGYSNILVVPVKWPILWTQLGLALATWRRYPDGVTRGKDQKLLDLLWIPAHTLPVLRRGFLGIGRRLQTAVTIHGLEYRWLKEYQNWIQRWYLPLSTYYAARAADRVICVSESTRRDLAFETKVTPEVTTVIYEGASKTEGKLPEVSLITKYGLEKKKYVLFVGTVQPRKNISALLRAFSVVKDKYLDYKLVIAGNMGWDYEQELRLVETLDLLDRVVWMGRTSVEALRQLYLGAKLYVQPSWTEGFGLPVLEAMSAGVPVVASNGGALPELVGGVGIVVNNGVNYVGDLAVAMETVISDSVLATSMIAKGKLQVERFNWDKAAKFTLVCLTDIRLN